MDLWGRSIWCATTYRAIFFKPPAKKVAVFPCDLKMVSTENREKINKWWRLVSVGWVFWCLGWLKVVLWSSWLSHQLRKKLKMIDDSFFLFLSRTTNKKQNQSGKYGSSSPLRHFMLEAVWFISGMAAWFERNANIWSLGFYWKLTPKKHRKASTLSQSQFPKILSSVKFVKKISDWCFTSPKLRGDPCLTNIADESSSFSAESRSPHRLTRVFGEPNNIAKVTWMFFCWQLASFWFN